MTAREISAGETGNEPPASAADWLEAGPEDRHPDGFEARADAPAELQLWERQGITADTAEVHLDEAGFPEGFQGAGPMFAAVPLGAPWYQLAMRGATTYIPGWGVEGAAEPECAFLDRDQAEVVADASTYGELSRYEGLAGWNDVTAARAEAERQAEDAAWGGRGPSASYAARQAEGQLPDHAACPHPPGECPFAAEPEAGA